MTSMEQELREKCSDQSRRISLLEHTITQQNEQILALLSELDKYKSIIHSPNKPTPRKVRTQGISAEPKTLQTLEDFKIGTFKPYPKPQSTKDFLIGAILSNDFMKNLSSHNISEIVEQMYPVECKKGSMVITEGEVGSIVYVMEEGLVEVTKDGLKLSVMSPGKVFGELAVLYNCTRTASVRALHTCVLWALDRSVYQAVLIRTEMINQQQKLNLLKKVPMYEREGDRFLQHVVDSLDEVHYDKEKIIINQQQLLDCLYVVATGSVREVTGEGREVKTYSPADFFGSTDCHSKITSESAFICTSDAGCDLYIIDNEMLIDLFSKVHLSSVPREERSISKTQDLPPVDIRHPSHLTTISTIGVGGFGRVDLVQPLNDSTRSYALKKMKKSHIVETRQQEHIINERNIMLEARCDFIVRLHKTFKDNKHLYMLLEACLGGELWTLLRDKLSFDEGTTRFYLGCVVEALSYLHQRGIIYRDLKPENLLLDNQGYIKLVDFGFAKKIGAGRRTWTFCGTPEYVAPEIILNRGHDVSSDLWSLGILTFELLTGNPPFTGSEPMKTYNLILKGIDSVTFSFNIPKHAQNFIRKLCRETPTERLGHGSGSLREVRRHKWMAGLNWDALKNKSLKAPFVLAIKSASDVSNFDSFPPEECLPPPDDVTGWDRDF